MADTDKKTDTTATDKAKDTTKPEKQDEKVETKTETTGELAKVFADDSKDENKEKPAPKAGDLKFTVPDDLKDLVGDASDYVAAAREAGITQAQLDKWMAVHLDRVKAAAQEADQEAERISLEWKREIAGDEKLGGAKLQATMATAERGARALGGSSLAVKLARHLKGEEVIDGPTLVRAFHLAGLAHNEDRLGGDGGPTPKDDDASLTPLEREFKRVHPESHKRIQTERNERNSTRGRA